ncbi:MAG: hypothetical protein KF678_04205 [Phycisphaeraceae bacterium]|nr:hypothetical protein [Phycisphaeraceae bacterium]
MPIDLHQFIAVRPHLFHLTARTNLSSILREGRIESASRLLHRAGRTELVNKRRKGHLVVAIDGWKAELRDQAPLHEGNVVLSDGWGFSDLVKSLNDRVFFWPGKSSGPIPYGVRHFERYKHEDVVVLEIGTDSAMSANSLEARYCRYNSGSPRCSGGRKSPRGPQTFARAKEFNGTACDVVEVTFEGSFELPRSGVRVAEVSEWIER